MTERETVQDLLARVVGWSMPYAAPGTNVIDEVSAVLDDGTRLVVLRSSPAIHLVPRITGDQGRELRLWSSGVLDRLPPGVGHAVVAAAPEDDGWVVVIRDYGEAVGHWGQVLAPAELRRVLTALARMHATFAGEGIEGLCSPATWTAAWSPPVMSARRTEPGGMPGFVLAAWETFFARAPRDVADAVAAVHADPAGLGAALDRCEPTLLNGQVVPPNLVLDDDRVVLLRWGLATRGPAELDVAAFLACAGRNAGAPPDAVLAEAAVIGGDRWDARAEGLALLAAFAGLGHRIARAAFPRTDPETGRDRQGDGDDRAAWGWWVDRVRRVLAGTWAPT